MLASGLWWIVVGRGGARHDGEKGGRMGEDGRGRMGKLKWEGSRFGVRRARLLRW